MDKRVERNRKKISRALIGLIKVKQFEQIKITDIVAKAGIGRSTFYNNFKSKDEAIQAAFALILETSFESAKFKLEVEESIDGTLIDVFFLELLMAFKENQIFLSTMMSESYVKAQELLNATISSLVEHQILQQSQRFRVYRMSDYDAFITLISGGILASIIHILDRPNTSYEQKLKSTIKLAYEDLICI